MVERSTPGGALTEQAIEVGNGSGGPQRLQHERGHRIETDDGKGGRSHATTLSQAVCGPPSPTGWALAGRTPVQSRQQAARSMAGERLTSPGLVLSHGLRDASTESTERTEAAVTSDTPLHQLLRALVRFWWVAIVGIVLAVVVFAFATYHVSAGFPPTFESRAQSTYTASTQVLITSKREPYLSATNVNAKIINLPTSDTSGAGTTGTNGTSAQTSTYDSGSGADGDLARLVEIANDLPPRVTSDPVIALRNRLYRRVNGSVTAVNPYAFSGAGGFRSGPLPYIKITGTANSKQDALDITNSTALAFKRWFEGRQAAAKIKSADRVVVEQVNSADNAFPQGGSKPLLGIAAALLVLLGVAGLVLALDRLIPHTIKSRRSAVNEPRERPEPVPVPAPERPTADAPRAPLAPRPAESRPVAANPFEPKPFERRPVEVEPVATQRAEPAPLEDRPADDTPVQDKPARGQARRGHNARCRAGGGQARRGHTAARRRRPTSPTCSRRHRSRTRPPSSRHSPRRPSRRSRSKPRRPRSARRSTT